MAYDPQTGKPGVQTVEHTFIDHDTDLLDVTLRVATPTSAAGKKAPPVTGTAPGATPAATGVTSQPAHPTNSAAAQDAPATTGNSQTELVHTTAHHPWYTGDYGWLPAGFLKVGEPVFRVDGTTATVVAIRTVSGTADMWDLTVSNVHTFAVGDGHYVVHNSSCPRWFKGKKPGYKVNDAHVPGRRGWNPRTKTRLPNDAESVYQHAVPDDPDNPGAWYGKNSKGDTYRYQGDTEGDPNVHFNGSTGDAPIGGKPLNPQNFTPYARARLARMR